MSLNVEHLSFAYQKAPVLSDISFTLGEGEILSVLGPNGVGKTTLFRCILGLVRNYQGRVTVDGQELRRLSNRELAGHIAFIPQNQRPTFGYTVLDTVLMGTTRQFSPFSGPKEKQVRQAVQALERVGAEHLMERDFSKLSGGEQQLVLIARAIVQQAKILIMDEPTSALDYGNQFRTLELIQDLAEDGYAVMVSTHNPQHALMYSSHILALSGGRVAAWGRGEEVLTQELVERLYGVEVTFAQTQSGKIIVPIKNRRAVG